MARTKTLLFDDDVVNTFGSEGMNFTIDEVLARWQAGTVSRDITRRAISQCMVALVALPVNEGGWSVHHCMAMYAKVQRDYPALYAQD